MKSSHWIRVVGLLLLGHVAGAQEIHQKSLCTLSPDAPALASAVCGNEPVETIKVLLEQGGDPNTQVTVLSRYEARGGGTLVGDIADWPSQQVSLGAVALLTRQLDTFALLERSGRLDISQKIRFSFYFSPETEQDLFEFLIDGFTKEYFITSDNYDWHAGVTGQHHPGSDPRYDIAFDSMRPMWQTIITEIADHPDFQPQCGYVRAAALRQQVSLLERFVHDDPSLDIFHCAPWTGLYNLGAQDVRRLLVASDSVRDALGLPHQETPIEASEKIHMECGSLKDGGARVIDGVFVGNVVKRKGKGEFIGVRCASPSPEGACERFRYVGICGDPSVPENYFPLDQKIRTAADLLKDQQRLRTWAGRDYDPDTNEVPIPLFTNVAFGSSLLIGPFASLLVPGGVVLDIATSPLQAGYLGYRFARRKLSRHSVDKKDQLSNPARANEVTVLSNDLYGGLTSILFTP